MPEPGAANNGGDRRLRTFIVAPAYQEASTIAVVVAGCRRHAPDAAVLVIDDGSEDGTGAAAETAGATVLRNPVNSGKGAALLRGMRTALAQAADVIVTIDADGQHRPEDLPMLLEASRAWPGCIIIGSRRASRAAAPRSRRIANRVADFWISWAARAPVEDSQCGFRAYPAAVLAGALGHGGRLTGFAFESEVLIEAGRRGVRTVAVAVPAIYGPALRRSHFRPVADIARIVVMVAGKLLQRWMDPLGLWRALRQPALRHQASASFTLLKRPVTVPAAHVPQESQP